jgi:hypothetical protein
MEFEGTTSVSQFAAQRAADALKLWLAGLGEPKAYGLPGPSARLLEMAFAEDPQVSPTPIEGVENIWCSSASVRGKLALLNLVKTCH